MSNQISSYNNIIHTKLFKEFNQIRSEEEVIYVE